MVQKKIQARLVQTGFFSGKILKNHRISFKNGPEKISLIHQVGRVPRSPTHLGLGGWPQGPGG